MSWSFGLTPCSEYKGNMVLRNLVSYHITTRCHNLEDRDLNFHLCKNVKSHIPTEITLFLNTNLWELCDFAVEKCR